MNNDLSFQTGFELSKLHNKSSDHLQMPQLMKNSSRFRSGNNDLDATEQQLNEPSFYTQETNNEQNASYLLPQYNSAQPADQSQDVTWKG